MFNINYSETKRATDQFFFSHCEKARNVNGSFAYRAFHFFMSVIEYTPIIGDIIALFEMLVLTTIAKFKKNIPSKIEHKKVKTTNLWSPIAKCAGLIVLVGFVVFSIDYYNKWSLKAPGGLPCLVNELDFCRKKHTYLFLGLIENEDYLKCRQKVFYLNNPFGRTKYF